MSIPQQELLQRIEHGETPIEWRTQGFAAHQPSVASWLRCVRSCKTQLLEWQQHGPPARVWLGGLCQPRAYLCAMRMSCAALLSSDTNVVCVDAVQLHTKVLTSEAAALEKAAAQAATAAYRCTHTVLDGMSLIAAAWDEKEQELVNLPAAALVSDLPCVQLMAVPQSPQELRRNRRSTNDGRDAGSRLVASYKFVYHCPVYHTNRSWVMDVDLPTSAPPGHWALRATAIDAAAPQ